jgi:hypothetical protein
MDEHTKKYIDDLIKVIDDFNHELAAIYSDESDDVEASQIEASETPCQDNNSSDLTDIAMLTNILKKKDIELKKKDIQLKKKDIELKIELKKKDIELKKKDIELKIQDIQLHGIPIQCEEQLKEAVQLVFNLQLDCRDNWNWDTPLDAILNDRYKQDVHDPYWYMKAAKSYISHGYHHNLQLNDMIHDVFTVFLTQAGDGKTAMAFIMMVLGYNICYIGLRSKKSVSSGYRHRLNMIRQNIAADKTKNYYRCWLNHMHSFRIAYNDKKDKKEHASINCILHLLYYEVPTIDTYDIREDTAVKYAKEMSSMTDTMLPVLFVDDFFITGSIVSSNSPAECSDDIFVSEIKKYSRDKYRLVLSSIVDYSRSLKKTGSTPTKVNHCRCHVINSMKLYQNKNELTTVLKDMGVHVQDTTAPTNSHDLVENVVMLNLRLAVLYFENNNNIEKAIEKLWQYTTINDVSKYIKTHLSSLACKQSKLVDSLMLLYGVRPVLAGSNESIIKINSTADTTINSYMDQLNVDVVSCKDKYLPPMLIAGVFCGLLNEYQENNTDESILERTDEMNSQSFGFTFEHFILYMMYAKITYAELVHNNTCTICNGCTITIPAHTAGYTVCIDSKITNIKNDLAALSDDVRIAVVHWISTSTNTVADNAVFVRVNDQFKAILIGEAKSTSMKNETSSGKGQLHATWNQLNKQKLVMPTVQLWQFNCIRYQKDGISITFEITEINAQSVDATEQCDPIAQRVKRANYHTSLNFQKKNRT